MKVHLRYQFHIFSKWAVEGKVLRRCNVGCNWNRINLTVYSVTFDVSWVKCFVKVSSFFLVQFCQVSINTFLSVYDIVICKGDIVFTRWVMTDIFLAVVTPTKVLDIQFSANFSPMILFAFSSNSSKLSGLSPIWYILISCITWWWWFSSFWLFPLRFPQAARLAAKATRLADAKHIFSSFHYKTPFLF